MARLPCAGPPTAASLTAPPPGRGGARTRAAVAVALDLAQDLAVHERGGAHGAATASELGAAGDPELIVRVGASDLRAHKALALAGRVGGETRPASRRVRKVRASARAVLVEVAQDVRPLHGDAQRGGLALGGPPGAEPPRRPQ